MFSLCCRIFEFRKIIGDRELCKSLVPKDYPVYITKVRETQSLLSAAQSSNVLRFGGVLKMSFASLWADEGRCRLSHPRRILHLSSWTFRTRDLATRSCSCQVRLAVSGKLLEVCVASLTFVCSFRFQFVVPKKWRRNRPVCIHLAGTGDHVRMCFSHMTLDREQESSDWTEAALWLCQIQQLGVGISESAL